MKSRLSTKSVSKLQRKKPANRISRSRRMIKATIEKSYYLSMFGRLMIQYLIVTPAQERHPRLRSGTGVQKAALSSSKKSSTDVLLQVNPENTICLDSLLTFILFEFWTNLASHLVRSFTNPISIGFRKRSNDLFCPIVPNSQMLTQFAG